MNITHSLKRIHAAIVNDTGDRYCESCRSKQPRAGGGFLLTMGGMRRKWLCQSCLRAKARRG